MPSQAHLMKLTLFHFLLLLNTWRLVNSSEGVSAGLPDGARFQSGQTVTFVCKAFGVLDGLAVRLFCPLARHAGSSATSACFEDCRKPLCADSAGLADCQDRLPELLRADCATAERLNGEVSFVYRFSQANVRHTGNYTCQYKQMRSTVLINVAATTTAATTTTSTTTSTSTTSAPTTTETTTAKSTTTTTTKRASLANSATSSGGSKALETSKSSPAPATTSAATVAVKKVWQTSATGSGVLTLPPPGAASTSRGTTTPGEDSVGDWTTESSDWFNTEAINSLKNGHVLIGGLGLLIVIIITLTVSLLCWKRCQSRNAAKRLRNGGRQPPQGRASGAGSMVDAAEVLIYGQQMQLQQQRPPPLPTQSRPGSQSFASQIYNEADPAPGAPPSNSDGSSYYARPAPAPASATHGGGGGFFSRSQGGRHSFHSVRQQQAIGGQRIAGSDSAELLSGGRGEVHGGGAAVSINVGGGIADDGRGYGHVYRADGEYHEMVRLLTDQGKELQRLNQQVRASQLALSRLAASYHDLHRSVSMSRVRHASSPRNSPVGAGRQEEASRGSSAEDPYDEDAEITRLLPSPLAVAAATAAMTAAAGDDADSTDGLSSGGGQQTERLPLAVGTINEELEGEDTLRPKKQQQQQQQHQQQQQQQHIGNH